MKYIFLIFLAGSIISFIFLGIINPLDKPMDDFGVYYHTAEILNNGNNNIYSVKIHTDVFNYPPVFAILLKPLAFFNYRNSQILWHILSLVSYLSSAIIVAFIFSGKDKYVFLFFIALFLFFQPAYETFKWGQVNAIIFFFIAAGLLFLKYKFKILSGILFGLAAAIKLSPLIIFIPLILKKEYKSFFVMLFTLFFLNLLSCIYTFDLNAVLKYYIEILPELMQRGMFDNPYNLSFHSLFQRLFLPGNGYSSPINIIKDYKIAELSSSILTKSFSYSILIISFIYAIRNKMNASIEILIAVVLNAALISSNIAWEHHYVILLLGYCAAFKLLYDSETLENRSQNMILFFRILLAISFAVISASIGYDNKIFLGGWKNLFVSVKLYSAAALWMILIKFSWN